jgi:hypothetical protein
MPDSGMAAAVIEWRQTGTAAQWAVRDFGGECFFVRFELAGRTT